MKVITLRSVEIASGPHKGERLDYLSEYTRMVELFPEGVTVSEMSVAIKVSDKLHAANGKVELEDAEAIYLLRRAEAMKYTIAAKEIVEMVDNLR